MKAAFYRTFSLGLQLVVCIGLIVRMPETFKRKKTKFFNWLVVYDYTQFIVSLIDEVESCVCN